MTMRRALFGPSKPEIWRQLSEEMHGRYVEGGFGAGDRVQATHGPWTLTLDTYVVSTGKTSVPFTRMRAPYRNSGGFRFTISRAGVLSGVATWLGMQDVEIGDAPFDRDFVIKATDEGKVRRLLSDPTLRALITGQPAMHLTVRDDEGWFGPHFPEAVDELRFAVPGVIKDVERLKQLYALFAATLDQLCRIGVTYKEPPGVTL